MRPKKTSVNFLIHLHLLLAVSCLQPYEPSVITDAPSHLVVEGFLNTEEGWARVRLSRTIPLNETGKPPGEIDARVSIEDDHGRIFQLSERGGGDFCTDGLPINPLDQYRLKIETSDDNRFASDFITIKETPPIDSLTWSVNRDGALDINLHTHDPAGSTRFYRWDYTETWEYISKYVAGFIMDNGHVIELPFQQAPYTCWKTENSTNILVDNTSGLGKDQVSNFKLTTIARESNRLNIRYSILVRQYALAEVEYAYWVNLKKNTETLGGLFDPLPSQVEGNVHASDGTKQPVIGFFSAGSIAEKRIFIDPTELPEAFSTFQHPRCEIDTILTRFLPSLPDSKLLLFPVYNNVPTIIGYLNADIPCMDCRALGGQTTKPDFWN